MTETKEIKAGRRFFKKLLICALSIIFVGAIACIILYQYAAVYEVTRPEIVMEGLMGSLSRQDWADSAKGTEKQYVSKYENATEIFEEYFSTVPADSELSYCQNLAIQEKDRVGFYVKSGSKNLYSVILTPSDEKSPGFGRHFWKTESIEIADFTRYLSSVSIELEAPVGERVFINSIPVDEDIFESVITGPVSNPIELGFNNLPEYARYSIKSVFGDIVVTDSRGNELEAEYDEAENVYRYVAYPETLHSIVIEAPEDVTVSLCGVRLTHSDGVKREDSIFDGFEAYTDNCGWHNYQYSFEKLLSEPEVSAVDSEGNALVPVITDSGRVVFFYPNDENLQQQVQNNVVSFFNAYMEYSSRGAMSRLSTLLDKTLDGTRLDSYFRYSAEAMSWASSTTVSYEELEFSNFRQVGDNCFFCTVQYKGNFTAKSWYEKYSYDMKNGYELLFVKAGRTWLVAEMSAFL